MKKRVVVTGMGIVSSLGNEIEPFFQSLLKGESSVKLIDSFSVEDFPTKFAAPVPDFECDQYIEKKLARRVDPFLNLRWSREKRLWSMPNWGNLKGGIRSHPLWNYCGLRDGRDAILSDNLQVMLEKGHRRVSPFFIPYIITNMASGMLAMDTGFMGPNYSISTACATGNHSIISAAQHIRNVRSRPYGLWRC